MVVYAYNSANKFIGQIEKTDNILQKNVLSCLMRNEQSSYPGYFFR